MSKRPAATTTTRGRGRGRGRGAGSRGASTAAAKRTKKNQERECLFLLIDSGLNSSLTELNEKTSFQNSINITDWILSRKIFAESDSYVNVAHFPSSDSDDVYENVKCYSDTFIKPVIDQLKWVYDIQQSKGNGDFITALRGSLEFVKQASSTSYVDRTTIAVLSNFSGEVENASEHDLKELCDGLNENGVALLFIGDNTTQKSEIPKTTLEALEYVKEHCTSESQLFENALNKVSFFAQKPKSPRAMPFTFELSKDLKIELQLYVKIFEEKISLKFDKVTEDNEVVSKIREYEEVKETETKKEIDEDDNGLEEAVNHHENEENSPQKLSKEDIIKGYKYGSSIIPFNEGDKKMAAIEKIKCLQLVQFTNKSNILPQFLLSECRYFLPSVKSDTASTALAALVQAMINLDVVAIVRYAYNSNSSPHLCALFPKFSKTGCPVLQHFVLPFNEDIRGFEFPELGSMGEEPNDFQHDAIDAYIDELMLVNKVKDESGKMAKIEHCRIKDIRNPQNQSILMSVKRKALNMPTDLTKDEKNALFEMMSAPPETLERGKKVMNALAKSFKLVTVEPKKSEMAGIDGKSWNELHGGGKIEKYEDMNID